MSEVVRTKIPVEGDNYPKNWQKTQEELVSTIFQLLHILNNSFIKYILIMMFY
jgi:hypothetical protein